jgi:hypothetical protein
LFEAKSAGARDHEAWFAPLAADIFVRETSSKDGQKEEILYQRRSNGVPFPHE